MFLEKRASCVTWEWLHCWLNFHPLGFVFACCGLTLNVMWEVFALSSSIPQVYSLSHQIRSHSGAIGVCWDFFKEPLSVWDPGCLPCSWPPWPGMLGWGLVWEILVQTASDWMGFQGWALCCFSERRKAKPHKSHMTSRVLVFFPHGNLKVAQSIPEEVMHRTWDSCITPINTTAALQLVWEKPGASRGFKKGENLLESVVFTLFSLREKSLGFRCSHCPCEHLWQHYVLWVQPAGPWASVAGGEGKQVCCPCPCIIPHPACRQPAPCWQRFLLFRATQPGFHLCESPEKEEENWEELPAWILTAFPFFFHTQSFWRGCGRCLANQSIRETSPGIGRRLCEQVVHEFLSSEGSRAMLWSPSLYPWGLKTYLAKEEIIFKGLALNLEGLCGLCHLLPSTHSLESRTDCREKQQAPRAWKWMCEPVELTSGCKSGCEPLLCYFCPLTLTFDPFFQSRPNPVP